MATPLNRFKTVTFNLTNSNSTVYTAPTGFTGIVLMAQVANITTATESVTFSHFKTSTSTQTELVKDFDIPGNDAASVVTGKLILEEGDSVRASAGNSGALKLTLSILESLDA